MIKLRGHPTPLARSSRNTGSRIRFRVGRPLMHSPEGGNNSSSASQLPKRVTINLFFQHSHRDVFCTVAPYRSAPCFLCAATTHLPAPSSLQRRRGDTGSRCSFADHQTGNLVLETGAADQKLVSLHLRSSVLRTEGLARGGKNRSARSISRKKERDREIDFFLFFSLSLLKLK